MEELSKIFGINIEDEDLFRCALTHTSYVKEHQMDYSESYERLEFLGDAVLKLAVSDILYKMYPDYAEGDLSKIRSIVVSDTVLSEICEKIGLSGLIILSQHEEKQGCRNLESIRACVFEAVLGAYYLDGKFSNLVDFIKDNLSYYIEDVDCNFEKYNAKTMLQEYVQKQMKIIPQYRLINETGPAHKKTFEVEVLLNSKVTGTGTGKSKKEAEQHAAHCACEKLGITECQE